MIPDTAARMREDWNQRAREDAHYYVAFGRRDQPGDEFFDTGHEQVQGLLRELKRFPGRNAGSLRALEIGCGPGRLMRPLAAHFAEVHGIDISDEMVARAKSNLAAVPNAHPRHAPHSNLDAFAGASFDFIYSYAVFQHIPSREVVMGYLNDALRVLAPGGLIRVQINGLPQTAKTYDTWSGVRIAAQEIRDWSAQAGVALLALEGMETQYMWATLRKNLQSPNSPLPSPPPRIRRITNAHSSDPLTPVRGRFAAMSLWVDRLPEQPDLNRTRVNVHGKAATLTYLGPPEHDGLRQLNLLLPGGLRTGLAPVELFLDGVHAPATTTARLTPPGPAVPRIMSLTDGTDLMSSTEISSGTLKLVIEEVDDPTPLAIEMNGHPVPNRDNFRTDPRLPRWEVNFHVPPAVQSGPAAVSVQLGHRNLGLFTVSIL